MEKKSIISNVGRKGSFLHRTVDRVYIEYINLWRTDKESNIYKLYSTLISLTYVCSMSKNTSITNTFNTIGRLNPTPPPPPSFPTPNPELIPVSKAQIPGWHACPSPGNHPAFHQASLTAGRYLGGEKHCESEVFGQRTQHSDLARCEETEHEH